MKLSLLQIVLGTVGVAVLTILGAWLVGAFEGLGAGGAFALVLGITVSFAVGIGLMAAVFYSNRAHDEAAHQAARHHFH